MADEKSKEIEELAKRTKLLTDELKEVDSIIKRFSGGLGEANGIMEAMGANLGKINDLSELNTKEAKSEKKFREDTNDITKEILSNVANIGREEFKTFDLSAKIGRARRMGDKALVGQLKHAKSITDEHARQHKLITEQAELLNKPFEALDSMIKQIPIIGNLLSSALGIDSIGEDIKNAFTASAADKIFGKPKEEAVAGGIDVEAEALMGEAMEREGELTDGNTTDLAYRHQEIKANKREQEGLEKKLGYLKQESLDTDEKSVEATGGILSNISLTKVAIAAVVAAGAYFLNQMKGVADSLGTSYKSAFNLANAINPEAAIAFAKEFGTVNNLSAKSALNLRIMEKRFGISADNAAKTVKAMSNISSLSNDALISQLGSTAQLARQAGVAPAQVMEDIANNAELFAKFGKDGGDNLMKAAVEAAKLGISLSDVSASMESMLNFEDSITKQMEAEVLLGRQLNLDKARELSLDGDAIGLQKELVNLVGSESELNSLNQIQRTALADALGISLEKMASIVGAEERLNEAQAKSNQEAWKKFALFASIGAMILGIVGAIAGALIGTGVGAGFGGAMLAGIKTGGIYGVATGAAIGTGAAALTSEPMPVMNDGGVTEDGTIITSPKGSVKLNPQDSLVAGTNLLGGGMDMTKTNQLINKLVEQNERLLNKLIKKTGDLGLAS